MDLNEKYQSTKRTSNATKNWLTAILNEVKIVSFARLGEFKTLFRSFWQDLKTGDWQHRGISIISLLIIISFFVIIPFKETYDFLKWEYREFKINYTEIEPQTKTKLDRQIHQFAEDYTRAFGTDCEWFRNRDVDIEMWEDLGNLYRDSYPCVNFNNTADIVLFPISIGNTKNGDLIETVDVKFGRVEFNDSGAKKYTTIESKLWRLKDESIWRIDRMKNIQKHEF